VVAAPTPLGRTATRLRPNGPNLAAQGLAWFAGACPAAVYSHRDTAGSRGTGGMHGRNLAG